MYAKYVSSQQSKGNGNEEGRRNFFINRRYLATLGCFILALLSKPMAVSLPIVLLLLDWFPFNRIRSGRMLWTACAEKLPFFALGLAASIVTILTQRAEGAMTLIEVPLSTRLLVAAESLIMYLWKMIAPVHLVPYYPYPESISFLSLEYLSAITLVIGITAACMVTAKKQKLWLTAWGYYVVTLVPVLGIIQVGGQAMADRYTYLPSLGPFFILGLAVAWVWRTVNALPRPGLVRVACGAAAIFVFAALSHATLVQIIIWKNSFTLWGYVIEKEPGRVPMAYAYRGVAFERGGRFDKAIEDYERAIALNPSYYPAYNNMGALLGKMSLFARAIEYFNKAIALSPDYTDAYYNRGVTYVLIDQFGKALEDFNKAIVLNPGDATAYVERGNLHLRMGNRDLAIADFQIACDLGYEKGCNALQ
jgi:tetratricopeptide (TPR) repeat protein